MQTSPWNKVYNQRRPNIRLTHFICRRRLCIQTHCSKSNATIQKSLDLVAVITTTSNCSSLVESAFQHSAITTVSSARHTQHLTTDCPTLHNFFTHGVSCWGGGEVSPLLNVQPPPMHFTSSDPLGRGRLSSLVPVCGHK